MEVSRIRALRGPNLWSRHTAIEAIVTCAENERDINLLPGFETRLRERFPEIDLLQPAMSAAVVSLGTVGMLAAGWVGWWVASLDRSRRENERMPT